MAKDSNKVRVPLTGSVWYSSNLAATIPDDLTTDPTINGFVDLGYTTADGVTFNLGREIEGIDAWQTSEVLRQLVTSEPKSASFTLRQLGRDEWLATNGGSITTLGSGVYRWEPAAGAIPEGILLVDFVDGTKNYRFGFRRAQQTAEVEFNLVRNDALNLPNTWTAIQPTDPAVKSFFMDTDDTAFAASAALSDDPVIESITPAGQAIGEHVYIEGVRFTGLTGITIDSEAVVSPVLVNDGLIDATIPAAVTTGVGVDVVVTTDKGSVTAVYVVSAT